MIKNKVIKTTIILLVSIVIVIVFWSGILNLLGIGNAGTSTINKYSDYYLENTRKEPTNGAVKVTFYGTTMFLLDDGKTKLLFDAFITRPSFGISARSLLFDQPLIETNKDLVDTWLSRPEVGKPTAMFIAHSHHDHAMDIAYIAQKTGAQVYGSASTLNIAKGNEVPEEKLSRYTLGKELIFNDFSVTVLPGRHALNPAPLPDDRGMLISEPLPQPAKLLDYVEGGAFDFLVKHGDHSILIKGHS